MIRSIILGAVLAIFTACISVDYLGKNYEPTGTVAMYFDRDDITEPYEVMGMMTAEAPELVNTGKLQQKMMAKAALQGADAILFEYMDKKVSATSTNTHEEGWGVHSTTSTSEEKVVQAKLIKYKRS